MCNKVDITINKQFQFLDVLKAVGNITLTCVGLCFFATSALAKQPLFENDTPLDAVLSIPLAQAYNQKDEDTRLYLDGNFSFKEANDEIVRIPLKVKTRGNYRRAHCSLPPLRLNFPKKTVKNTLFHGQDKMKLVGPCQPGGIYKDLVGLEFLAYQIFETVSDYALETRPMSLSYVDLDKKVKPRTTSAFVIEDISDLAKRKNLRAIVPEKALRSELDLNETALLEIFELFIANNDYSTLIGMPGDMCCHNVRMLAPKKKAIGAAAEQKLIPVPYDFDMSGLVDAPYAAPPGTLPIRKVRQRYFNGLCKDDQYFQAAIEKFRVKKPEIMALVDDSDLIGSSMKKKTRAFFEDFYEMVNEPSRYEKEIVGRCRGTTAS